MFNALNGLGGGGLLSGAPVQVAGYRVGKVSSIVLDGARVRVQFDIDKDVHLGDRTEAKIDAQSDGLAEAQLEVKVQKTFAALRVRNTRHGAEGEAGGRDDGQHPLRVLHRNCLP